MLGIDLLNIKTMYLKKLNIKYFRCFKNEERDFEVEFAPRVTVLFGKNGSGKSSLIHAIHKALSFIFHKDRGNNKMSNNLTVGFPELKVEKYEKKDAVRNFKTGFLYPFISIKAEGSFLEIPLDWKMYVPTSNKDWSPQKNGYSEALKNVCFSLLCVYVCICVFLRALVGVCMLG